MAALCDRYTAFFVCEAGAADLGEEGALGARRAREEFRAVVSGN
jgi:hypothetical protein